MLLGRARAPLAVLALPVVLAERSPTPLAVLPDPAIEKLPALAPRNVLVAPKLWMNRLPPSVITPTPPEPLVLGRARSPLIVCVPVKVFGAPTRAKAPAANPPSRLALRLGTWVVEATLSGAV